MKMWPKFLKIINFYTFSIILTTSKSKKWVKKKLKTALIKNWFNIGGTVAVPLCRNGLISRTKVSWMRMKYVGEKWHMMDYSTLHPNVTLSYKKYSTFRYSYKICDTCEGNSTDAQISRPCDYLRFRSNLASTKRLCNFVVTKMMIPKISNRISPVFGFPLQHQVLPKKMS